jgi:hypothetical protein
MVSNPEGIEFSSRGRALRDAHGPRKDMGPTLEGSHLRAVSDPFRFLPGVLFQPGGATAALGPWLLNRNLLGFLNAQAALVPFFSIVY